MAEDLTGTTELLKRLSESRTIISIDGRKFVLNEMTIKRVKEFTLMFAEAMESVSEKTGKNLSDLTDVSLLIGEFSGIVFEEIAKIFNFIFAYKNDGYKKVTPAWLAERLTVRMIKEIVKELAIQNNLEGLLPLIKGKIKAAMQKAGL